MKKVGLLTAQEEPFLTDITYFINRTGKGKVEAEKCSVPELRLGMEIPYSLIIDRISHCMPFYLQFSREALLKGTYVINNPFRFYVDKHFGYAAAREIGVPVPKTVLLPPKLPPRQLNKLDLGNLAYPLDWNNIIEYLGGFPLFFKPSAGWGWRDVFKVDDMEELMYLYDTTGSELMLLQENIEYNHYVRCFCLGRKYTLPIRYQPDAPHHEQYVIDHNHLTPEQGRLVHEYACALSDTLDFDMNVCEFAFRNGEPIAIDFTNMVPDMNPLSIRSHYYEWVIETLAGVAVEYAENPPFPGVWKSAEKIFQNNRK